VVALLNPHFNAGERLDAMSSINERAMSRRPARFEASKPDYVVRSEDSKEGQLVYAGSRVEGRIEKW
jgi:hypothetical protein